MGLFPLWICLLVMSEQEALILLEATANLECRGGVLWAELACGASTAVLKGRGMDGLVKGSGNVSWCMFPYGLLVVVECVSKGK